MQTSTKGIGYLELEEGVVLKAYRDPVGIWTIGAGLTAASGVVKPVAGMVITRDQARALLAQALTAKYEPMVRGAMGDGTPEQHEFDAGVSFHWNTGAITKASWVKAWAMGAPRADIRERLAAWKKGGGKVLPGLVARREREFLILMDGKYPAGIDTSTPAPSATMAIWALPLSSNEKAAALQAFRKLGYEVGNYVDGAVKEGVVRFQSDHGLTVDGIIGRATLSTLQRVLDARAKAVLPVSTAAGAAAASGSGADDFLMGLPYGAEAVGALALLRGLWVLFTYRDAVAAAVDAKLPRLAAFLRSF